MGFEIVGEIAQIQRIAAGPSVRVVAWLRRTHGGRRWRKMKGIATVRFASDRIVDLHWYEAHGIGRKEFKIKRYLRQR